MSQTPFAVPFGRQLRPSGSSRGTVLSAAVHAAALAVLVWAGRTHFEDAANAPGEGRGRGGGGGGGGIRAVAMYMAGGPAAASAPVVQAPPPPITVPEQIPTSIPEPVTPVEPAAPAPAPAAGAGEGAGQGAGSGPGAGTGTGGGTGSGTGPGVGGDSGAGGGGRVFPPQPQGIILPPSGAPRSLRGVRLTVTFRITERGEVAEVEVDPPIRDRGYRNRFLDSMRRYTFTPAYTRDGRPVAAAFPVQIVL